MPGDRVHIGAHGDPIGLKVANLKPAGLERIVARNRLSGDPAAADRDQDVMLVNRSGGVWHQDVERGDDILGLSMDTCFLQEFPDGCRPDRLAEFDLAAGESPQAGIGRIGPADQQGPIIMDDDGNDRGNG